MTGDPERLDYRRDSLAEIVLKQREIIERQAVRLIELGAMNLALRENAELFMSEEHQRYAEVLILLENWVDARLGEGLLSVDGGALREVIHDVFEYAEDGKEPPWFGAAVEAMGGEEAGRER